MSSRILQVRWSLYSKRCRKKYLYTCKLTARVLYILNTFKKCLMNSKTLIWFNARIRGQSPMNIMCFQSLTSQRKEILKSINWNQLRPQKSWRNPQKRCRKAWRIHFIIFITGAKVSFSTFKLYWQQLVNVTNQTRWWKRTRSQKLVWKRKFRLPRQVRRQWSPCSRKKTLSKRWISKQKM